MVPAPAEIDPAQVEIDPEARIQVRHILMAWSGARGASAALRRTREEAWLEITQVQQQLEQGEDFETLAQSRSDGSSSKKGGSLGVIEPGAMNPIFEAAAFSLEDDELSPIIETPFGFHIIERQPLVEIHILQVVVQWSGSRDSEETRSRSEALDLAERALSELEQGRDITEVVHEYSDGPMAPWGGDLGYFRKGVMLPNFEEQAFAISEAEWTGIIESDLGYHILYRAG